MEIGWKTAEKQRGNRRRTEGKSRRNGGEIGGERREDRREAEGRSRRNGGEITEKRRGTRREVERQGGDLWESILQGTNQV